MEGTITAGARRRTVAALAMLAVLLIPTTASVPSAAGIAPGLPVNEEDVNEVVLDNGVRILVVPRPGDPPVAAAQVWVEAGSIDEDPSQAGIAHFFEHMIFKGTDNLPPGEFQRRIERLGGHLNAGTTYDTTHYYGVIPAEHIEELVRLLGEVTAHPVFPAAELEREREVIYREIEFRHDDPRRFAFSRLMTELFPTTPHGQGPLGTRETVASVTSEDMFAFLNRHYSPERTTVVVTGAVDPDAVITAAKEAFGQIPHRGAPRSTIALEPRLTSRRSVTEIRDLEQGHLALGWHAPGYTQADPAEMAALDLAVTLLSGGRSSRFYRHIVRDTGLVTTIDATYIPFQGAGVVYVYAQLPAENAPLVEAAVLKEIDRLHRGDFTRAELERARTRLLADHAFGLESHHALATTLGYLQTVTGDWRTLLTYSVQLRSVTADDVIEAARRYLDPSRYVRLYIGPEIEEAQSAVPPVEALTEEHPTPTTDGLPPEPTTGVDELSAVHPAPDSRKSLSLAPPASDRVPARAQPSPMNGSGEPVRYVLPNGHVIILQEMPHSPVVAVQTFVRAGQPDEPASKPGLAALTQRMLLKGTLDLTEDELVTQVEDRGGRISTSMIPDASIITLGSLPEQLPALLPLYADVISRPRLSSEAFEREKAQMRRELEGALDNFFTVAQDGFLSGLYGSHPYGTSMAAQLEALDRITIDDVRAFHRAYYTPDNMVTAVVGPIEPQAVLGQLTTLFGQAAPSGPAPAIASDRVASDDPYPAAPVEVIHERQTQAGWLVLGFPAPPLKDERYAALKVLNTALGAGGGSLLYSEVRDRLGLAYATGSSYPSRRGPSYFNVYAVTPPTKEAIEAASAAIHDVFRMAAEKLSAEQAERARELTRAEFAMARQTASGQAWHLAWFETLGAGYDAVKTYPERVSSVTLEELRRLAGEIFQAHRSVRSVVAPSPVERNDGASPRSD